MTLDPDVVLDRRRLKRKLGFWRVIAFLAAGAALITGFVYAGGVKDLVDRSAPHVARVSITGFIRPDRKLVEMMEKIGKSSAVKGVVVEVNSAGGATVGGEQLYEAVRKLAEKKPTVVYIESLAASAGYMIALGADHIVARRSAITGSIGVLAQWGDVSGLMDKIGIRLEEVKSSPMKAEPSPFKPASPESKAMLDRMIQDTYRWFVGLVAERRKLAPDEALTLADGRVVTGAQALDLKLVDEVGGQDVAVGWLEREKGVTKDLPVRDWQPDRERGGWGLAESLSESTARGLLRAVGLETTLGDGLSLDGLRSVWHPSATENVK